MKAPTSTSPSAPSRRSPPTGPRAGRDDRRCSCCRRSRCTACSSSTRSSRALRYSLYDWNGLEPLDDFIGLDNFRRAFSDDPFRDALKHNVIIVVLSLLIQIPIALGLALLLNSRIRGRAVLRTLFFAPYVLSEVVTGVVWRQILRPDGLLDRSLDAVGASGLTHEWLADPDIVLYSLFFIISWKYFGFHMVIMLAGPATAPPRTQRGGRHRRRLVVADVPARHPAAARTDDPRVGLPLDHRRAAAVRPRVGDHEGRADRRLLDDGDVPLRPVPQGTLRLRQRRVDRDLRTVARGRAASTSGWRCDATCKGLVSLAEPPHPRCPCPAEVPDLVAPDLARPIGSPAPAIDPQALGRRALPDRVRRGADRRRAAHVLRPRWLPHATSSSSSTRWGCPTRGSAPTTPSILQSGSFWRQVWNSTLIALLTVALVLPAASMAAFVIARYSVPRPRAVLRPVHARPAVPRRGGDPAAVHRAAPGRAAQQPARRRAPPGGLRPADRDHHHAPVLPGDPAGTPGRGGDRRVRPAALLLVGDAAAVAAGAQHDRRDHDRRELERVLPAAARADRPRQARRCRSASTTSRPSTPPTSRSCSPTRRWR